MLDREARLSGKAVSSLASQRGGKRRIGIEELLAWAYRQELPKLERQGGAVAVAGGDVLSTIRELGTLVDCSPNGFGCIPDFSSESPPDPDALVVGRHVAALDGLVVDLHDVDLLGDPAFLVLTEEERRAAHQAGMARALTPGGMLRSSLTTIVIAAAVLGRVRPMRAAEAPKRSVQTRGGKPAWFRMVERSEGEGRAPQLVEMDGYDHRRQRPYPGAYRKTVLDPDPAFTVFERIEYQAWRFALHALAGALQGRLARFDVAPSAAPWWPWEGERAAPWPTIRPSLLKTEIGSPHAA